ncbi:MAG TPA: SpoIVB peptidase S55 domain-containing protein [Anaerohalosphaeraceae bacterium]|nr:SpoIVB peptidase S55 domain-containing protein [Anaerohalosphaeraceae bacterium]
MKKNLPAWTVVILQLLMQPGASPLSAAPLDPSRHIPLEQVRPGMEGYCLTVLEGTAVEKFPLKVLSIVRNAEPGSDFILVVGTDERFKTVGSVQGCSGSPVYLDGRLAGALAAGWSDALEPLYLVRPIQDMLNIESPAPSGQVPSLAPEPKDLIHPEKAQKRYLDWLGKTCSSRRTMLPLMMSVPAGAAQSIQPIFESLGFAAFTGAAADESAGTQGQSQITPGGVLSVVLCGGDISIAAIGTATDVVGDTVYGYGHSLLGTGAVQLPMAAGYIHTTIARRSISFKFGSPGPILGTLTSDQAAGIFGRIGQEPPMLPLRIHLERTDLGQTKEFNCRVAVHPMLTPLILRVVIMSAALYYGDLPQEHSLEYQGTVEIEGEEPIQFKNISTDSEALVPASEISGIANLLMNNPYRPAGIRSVELSLRISGRSRAAEIWAAELSDDKPKPGRSVTVRAVLESFRTDKTVHSIHLPIPAELKAGTYMLQVLDREEYLAFLQKASPHQFTAEDLPSMLEAVRRIVQMPRNQLTAVLLLGRGGIAIRHQDLPDLPSSRVLLLQDNRRFTPAMPLQNWIQTQITMDWVPSGNITVPIQIEP